MRGLLRKDLSLLKNNSTVYLVVILIFSAITVAGKGNYASMVVLLATMSVFNTFSYDDMAHWNAYCLALPVSRKQVVAAKYALCLTLWGASMFYAWVLGALAPMDDASALESFLPSLLMGSALLVALAITMPFLFKLGVEKARIVMMLAVAVPLLLAVGLLTAWEPRESGAIATVAYLMTAVALALTALSYFASVKVMEKKDL